MSDAQQELEQAEEAATEDRTSLQQGIDWVAKHWPRVRLGHEGFMLDKIQRQSRITEQLAKNTMTGDFSDTGEWPEDEDVGVNIGDHIHLHNEQPAPSPVVQQAAVQAPSVASKVAPYLIGASMLGGPVAGYALSQLMAPSDSPAGSTTTIVQDPTVDTYTDVQAVQIYKPQE